MGKWAALLHLSGMETPRFFSKTIIEVLVHVLLAIFVPGLWVVFKVILIDFRDAVEFKFPIRRSLLVASLSLRRLLRYSLISSCFVSKCSRVCYSSLVFTGTCLLCWCRCIWEFARSHIRIGIIFIALVIFLRVALLLSFRIGLRLSYFSSWLVLFFWLEEGIYVVFLAKLEIQDIRNGLWWCL